MSPKAIGQPREEVAQRGLRRDTGDDAQDTGGGQHRGAQRPHRGELQQDRGGRDDDDDGGDEPLDQGQLGLHAPGACRVGGGTRVPDGGRLDDGGEKAQRQPGGGADQDDAQPEVDGRLAPGCYVGLVVEPVQQGDEDHGLEGDASPAQQPPQRGLGVAGVDAAQQPVHGPGDGEREHDRTAEHDERP